MKKIRIALWITVLLALIAVGSLWLIDRNQGPTAVRVAPTESSVSANFELTDHNGMIQTDEDFEGQWMLVFFGFTHCPDVCPMGLATIAQVMDDLGPDASAVQPLFITVDPERDTPAILADYVPQFGPDIIGLGGSTDQIAQTADSFKIYYQKIEEASAPDEYTMGHTSSFLLFNPQGEFVRIYEYDQDPGQITVDLRERINE